MIWCWWYVLDSSYLDGDLCLVSIFLVAVLAINCDMSSIGCLFAGEPGMRSLSAFSGLSWSECSAGPAWLYSFFGFLRLPFCP